MAENQTMIVLAVVVLIGIILMQKRNPERMFRYWKLGLSVLVTTAVWLWYERITMFTATVGYGSFILLIFLIGIGWILYGVYKAELPA